MTSGLASRVAWRVRGNGSARRSPRGAHRCGLGGSQMWPRSLASEDPFRSGKSASVHGSIYKDICLRHHMVQERNSRQIGQAGWGHTEHRSVGRGSRGRSEHMCRWHLGSPGRRRGWGIMREARPREEGKDLACTVMSMIESPFGHTRLHWVVHAYDRHGGKRATPLAHPEQKHARWAGESITRCSLNKTHH